MSSAYFFNLDQSKILLSGNGLNMMAFVLELVKNIVEKEENWIEVNLIYSKSQ